MMHEVPACVGMSGFDLKENKMTDLTVLIPPAGEPVSLSQVKAFLRLGHSGEDGLVADLIASARARLEQEAGLALVTRTLQRVWTCWPVGIARRGVKLNPGPVTALNAVRVIDEAGVVTDHIGRFRLQAGRICLRPWSMVPAVSEGGHVEVEFQAGFSVPGAVPEDLQLAVKRLIVQAYARRGGEPFSAASSDALPEDVQAILDTHREVRL